VLVLFAGCHWALLDFLLPGLVVVFVSPSVFCSGQKDVMNLWLIDFHHHPISSMDGHATQSLVMCVGCTFFPQPDHTRCLKWIKMLYAYLIIRKVYEFKKLLA
jgi:hypothetical protein